MSIKARLAEAVKAEAEARGLSQTASQILVFLATEPVTTKLSDSELHMQLLRLGKDLIARESNPEAPNE